MKAREVNRKILRAGGLETRQVGSHKRFAAEYTKPDGTASKVFTTVPQHSGDIPIGTLGPIEKAMEPAFGKGWLQ